jgi:hypothetical protein
VRFWDFGNLGIWIWKFCGILGIFWDFMVGIFGGKIFWYFVKSVKIFDHLAENRVLAIEFRQILIRERNKEIAIIHMRSFVAGAQKSESIMQQTGMHFIFEIFLVFQCAFAFRKFWVDD